MAATERVRHIWMSLASVGIAVTIYLIARPTSRVPASARDLSKSPAVAGVVGPRQIEVTSGSALEKSLERIAVKSQSIALPFLTVTASVAAHSRRGSEKLQDRWQFQSSDVSSAYADWTRAQVDVEHGERQLAKTKELSKAQIDRFTTIRDRLKKLVEETGTETRKDLAAAEADLLQAQIQAQKDEVDAEQALNTALRNRAAAERALIQGGIDPSFLAKDASVAIIVAQVPEIHMRGIFEKQACVARFYGRPDRPCSGQIAGIVPTLSTDRRTLRVIIELDDPDNTLRCGMFADVGIGTDSREAILVPPEGVIHVGMKDYLLVRDKPGPWRVQEVELGEIHENLIEVRSGVTKDQEVLGKGAILLKPFIIQALEKK